MKKKKEKSQSVKQNSNNAFFMPTIMAYIFIFLTFLLWQTDEVLGYQNLAVNYEESINKEMALIKLEEDIKKSATINMLSPCIPSIYPGIEKQYENYSIQTTAYCLRMPKTPFAVPASVTVEPLVKTALAFRQESTGLEYGALQALILSIYTIERAYCWIGIPFDIAVTGPLAATEYEIVQTMPKYMIYDSTIKVNNSKLQIMVFYDLNKMEVDKVVYV